MNIGGVPKLPYGTDNHRTKMSYEKNSNFLVTYQFMAFEITFTVLLKSCACTNKSVLKVLFLGLFTAVFIALGTLILP